MTIPSTAQTVHWNTDINNGYDFKANKRYKLHRMGDLVMIFNPDEIILNNGEVTEDVMELAVFE